MNKTSVKIIKRKDVEAMANDKTQDMSEPKSVPAMSKEKNERGLHRKMADTVSSWIAESKENNRIKEISAIRELFGDDSLLSRTA